MPVSKLADLPEGGGGRWPLCGQGGFRSAHWGDLEIGYTVLSAPSSSQGLYEGLPGGLCNCPHYGYVFQGTVRCVYPQSELEDEVAGPGEAYFFRPGHYLVYEEDHSEVLELNPADALEFLMDHIERSVTKPFGTSTEAG
jgi:hypothetical protein